MARDRAWTSLGTFADREAPEFVSVAVVPPTPAGAAEQPVVAFADLYHGARLAVKKWSAALGWTTYAATSPFVAPSQFASPGGASFVSLALGPHGAPIVAYADETAGGKATVAAYRQGGWVAVERPAEGRFASRGAPAQNFRASQAPKPQPQPHARTPARPHALAAG
jgi:hypothetical protein